MVEITYLAGNDIAMAAMNFSNSLAVFEERDQCDKKRKAEEEQQPGEKPEPLDNPKMITVDDSCLLLIQNENGFLTLDVDGTRVDTSSLSADQRKRLIEMLNYIRPWLENKPAP